MSFIKFLFAAATVAAVLTLFAASVFAAPASVCLPDPASATVAAAVPATCGCGPACRADAKKAFDAAMAKCNVDYGVATALASQEEIKKVNGRISTLKRSFAKFLRSAATLDDLKVLRKEAAEADKTMAARLEALEKRYEAGMAAVVSEIGKLNAADSLHDVRLDEVEKDGKLQKAVLFSHEERLQDLERGQFHPFMTLGYDLGARDAAGNGGGGFGLNFGLAFDRGTTIGAEVSTRYVRGLNSKTGASEGRSWGFSGGALLKLDELIGVPATRLFVGYTASNVSPQGDAGPDAWIHGLSVGPRFVHGHFIGELTYTIANGKGHGDTLSWGVGFTF